MAQPYTRIKSDVEVTAQPFSDQGKDVFLVAALAATLVEYRRYVKQRNGSTGSEAVGLNWRMVSRLDQLQG